MPRFVVERITDALNQHRKSVRGSRVHVLGVAYKAGVNDIRESPALIVMKILADKGACSRTPIRTSRRCARRASSSSPCRSTAARMKAVDCVVILTAHREIDYDLVVRTAPLVVDTRNALQGCDAPNVIRL